MKKIFIALLCLVLSLHINAQTDTTGRSDLAYLFQNLNPANIPTGYLMEWGTDMTDKDDLNGLITDSNFVNNLDLVRMVYADLFSAKYNVASPAMVSPDALNTAIQNASANSLVLLYGQYATTNPYSIQNGRLTYSSGKITETGIGSIYNQQQVWAAYPKQQVYTNTVSLLYNPALYYNNTGVTISSLSADFGSGYIVVSTNATISHTYTDSSGIKIIKLKAVLSNGQQMETRMLVQVSVT